MPDELGDALRASQAEQVPVEIFFRSGRLKGVVTRCDERIVEIRHDAGRSLIAREHIDAITRE